MAFFFSWPERPKMASKVYVFVREIVCFSVEIYNRLIFSGDWQQKGGRYETFFGIC